MNIKKRTCINCTAFNPKPADDEPTCWNLIEGAAAGVRCALHLTALEDAQDKEFREAHRETGGFEGAVMASRAIQETRDLMRRVAV